MPFTATLRTGAAVIAAGVVAALLPVTPAVAADFSPEVQGGIGNDAARAASGFGASVEQDEGEEQIDEVEIRLERETTTTEGFTFDTDVPGNDVQVGAVDIEVYSNTGELTLEGTIHDANTSGCTDDQCVIVRIDTPDPIPDVEEEIGVNEVTLDGKGWYSVTASIGGLWEDPAVQSLGLKLKSLTLEVFPTAGGEVVFGTPDTAGTYDFYWMLGSNESAQSLEDTIQLDVFEYPPATPALQSPAEGRTVTNDRDVVLRWQQAGDRNGDAVTYDLFFDGALLEDDITATSRTFPTGDMPAGNHEWWVVATDSTGLSNASATRTFTVLDPSLPGTLEFQSASPGTTDRLIVSPALGAYVYEVNEGGELTQYGATTGPDRMGQSGRVVHTEGFFLAVHYRGNQNIATGVFAETLGGATRAFTDLEMAS